MTAISPAHRAAKKSIETLIAFGLAIVALAVYIYTCCPTIFADDCGEIATAVATGGVMHPPGYPLYCLVGGLFVHALPFGEPAYRLGLLSCVSASAAVAFTYLLGRSLGAGRRWAAAAALSFGFSLSLWQQATKVETYALNAAFAAGLLLLASQFNRTRETRHFYWLAVAGGLALTNHLTILWLIPGIFAIVLPALFETHGVRKGVSITACALVCCVLPLSLYGYEMIAARLHPGGQIWGDPSSLHRLILHVTGARYHGLFHLPTWDWFYHRDILFTTAFLWRNLGPLLLLSAIGAFAGLRHSQTRRVSTALLLGAAGYLTCNTLYHILNIFEYYTPLVMILAVLAGSGGQRTLDWMSTRFGAQAAHRPLSLLTGGAIVLALMAPLLFNWTACNRRHADYLRVLAENILRTTPRNSVIVSVGDNEVFPLWYVQEVLHERTDVTVLPREFFIDWGAVKIRETDGWCVKRIAAEHPETDVMELVRRSAHDRGYALSQGAFWDIVGAALAAKRAVYFTQPQPGDLVKSKTGEQILARIPGWMLSKEALLQHVVPAANPPTIDQSLATELRLESLLHYEQAPAAMFEYEPDHDITNALYASNLALIGQLLLDEKQFAPAYAHLGRAFDMNPNSAEIADAFGYASVMVGRTSDAIEAWRTAQRLDPHNPSYGKNIETALKQASAGKDVPG